MKDYIAGFTQQMELAISIGENAKLTPSANPIHAVLVTGLGGSGIGGTMMAQLTDKDIKVPMLVNKDYFLPAFVNENTLVIVCSYSGNTEETVQALQTAIERKAKIVCVTSGGKIGEMASQHQLDLISIPGGMPPRACFALSFVQLYYILHSNNLINDHFRNDLNDTVALLNSEERSIMQDAHQLASNLIGKMPVIYNEARYECVAVRWRQQINENSKMLCWHHVLPEMNHNELVGWTEAHPDVVVLMLHNEDDFYRTKKRMEITADVSGKYAAHVFHIHSKGRTPLQRAMYLLHLGDWVSWYIAEIKNIDATEVNVIDYLKKELSKV